MLWGSAASTPSSGRVGVAVPLPLHCGRALSPGPSTALRQLPLQLPLQRQPSSAARQRRRRLLLHPVLPG